MSIHQNKKNAITLYVMLFITLSLVAGTTMYLSHSATTEETLRRDKNIIPLNGPWKFIVGDNMQYARPGYDDYAGAASRGPKASLKAAMTAAESGDTIVVLKGTGTYDEGSRGVTGKALTIKTVGNVTIK